MIRGDVVRLVKEAILAMSKADLSNRDYVLDTISEFAKTQAMESALIASVDLLDKRDFGKIELLMSTAINVGVDDELTDYDPMEMSESRLEHRDKMRAGIILPNGISTGSHEMDVVLLPHKGWGRKELSVYLGGAKSGKTTALIEAGVQACRAGKNVFYATCEVSAEIISNRIDANICGIDVHDLNDRTTDTATRLAAYKLRAGIFKIAEYPSGGLTPAKLRRKLKRYRQQGIIFDVIIVDYADIMAADRQYNDKRHEIDDIYKALRAIASEENAAVLTASQTNRTGQKKAATSVTDETDVAEDFNKARHCDVMITINATEQERKGGELRLYFALVRNAESGFSLKFKTERAKMRFLTTFLGRDG
jgi:replicative DNA helicase